MKQVLRAILLLQLTLSALTSAAQTLFTYGTKTVSKQEFLKAFNKNNTDNKPSEKALREYLDLYVPFKLKVQAAYDAKLDTLANQRAELQAFRNQLVQSYLTDASSLQDLVDEAFARSQQDVRISHIFIAAPKDSAALDAPAAKKAKEAYEALQQGKNFGEVALTYSTDPSVKSNRGDLGYITVFSLPYELENLAYNTPLNKASEPYRSNAGYHIFKKTAERKSVGKIKIAQILLAFPPDANQTTRDELRKKADSLYSELKKGADFAKMAQDHSNDNFSMQQGGELPEFGAGRFEAPFELAAFALQKNNDISQPLRTEYGYHIIKRLDAHPVPTNKNDPAFHQQLEAQVKSDERMEISKKAFVQKVLKTIGYKKGTYNTAQLWAYTDSTLQNKPVAPKTTIAPVTVIFHFTKQQIMVKDWLAFRRATGGVDRITSGKDHQALLDYYLELAALEYYRNHLEEYNSDFAFQLKEFKDGNLLFEVMQRKVWDKASTDSVGLKKYFAAHKNEYWWENSVTAILFTAMHDSTARNLKSKIEKDVANWRSIVETYEGTMIADSGRFEQSQLPTSANTTQNVDLKPGLITPFSTNESDNSVSFAHIIKLFPQREPRSFDDAKGYVINDYQQQLETTWVTELRKKYPVKVNEQVFRSMIE